MSKLPIYIPFATRLFPGNSFDARQALAIHAKGISRAVQGDGHSSSKDMAFTMTAELFLMQHTCHWFCKSKTVASARMLALHQTPYAQLVASVALGTRDAYWALVRAEVCTRNPVLPTAGAPQFQSPRRFAAAWAISGGNLLSSQRIASGTSTRSSTTPFSGSTSGMRSMGETRTAR